MAMQGYRSERAERFGQYLIRVAKGRHGAKELSQEEAEEALSFLLSAEAHPAQIAAFITAMRFKGATVDELSGFLDAMEAQATLIAPQVDGLLNCNAPYDGRKKTLHLTIPAAIIAVTAGVPVITHSNTGLPPKYGVTTAQVLDALGIPSSCEPELVRRDIEQQGFGHLHAAAYLHGVERLKEIRKILHYRSFFHTCEVMVNPAGAKNVLLGAAHDTFQERFAQVSLQRGAERVMVVLGLDGGDELPVEATPVVEVQEGAIRHYTIEPTSYGLTQSKYAPCLSPMETATQIVSLLEGKESAHRDGVILNAGVRIYLGGKAETIGEGIEQSQEIISSGRAAEQLHRLINR